MRWVTVTSSTSSSKPEGARESARTRPVTMREDSRVRDLRVSKTRSGTAALGTMPWMVPVPSRKNGEEKLAGGAEIVEPAAEGDGLAFVLADVGDGGEGGGWGGGFGRPCMFSLRGGQGWWETVGSRQVRRVGRRGWGFAGGRAMGIVLGRGCGVGSEDRSVAMIKRFERTCVLAMAER